MLDTFADFLDFGEGFLHIAAIADDADIIPHHALESVAELERILAAIALKWAHPASANFLDLRLVRLTTDN